MFKTVATIFCIFGFGLASTAAALSQPARVTKQGTRYDARLRSWMLPDGKLCTSDQQAESMLLGRSRGQVTYLIGAPVIPESLKGWSRSEYVLKTSIWKYVGKPVCDATTGYMTNQIVIYFDENGAVNDVQFL